VREVCLLIHSGYSKWIPTKTINKPSSNYKEHILQSLQQNVYSDKAN